MLGVDNEFERVKQRGRILLAGSLRKSKCSVRFPEQMAVERHWATPKRQPAV